MLLFWFANDRCKYVWVCVCYHKKRSYLPLCVSKQTPLQLYSNTQTKNEYKYFTKTDEYVVHVVVDNDIPKICNNVIIQLGNHSSGGKYTFKGKIVKGTGLIKNVSSSIEWIFKHLFPTTWRQESTCIFSWIHFYWFVGE